MTFWLKRNRPQNTMTWPQNVGNRISEDLNFKIFRGRMPPDPPIEPPSLKSWIRPRKPLRKKIEKGERGLPHQLFPFGHPSKFLSLPTGLNSTRTCACEYECSHQWALKLKNNMSEMIQTPLLCSKVLSPTRNNNLAVV